VKQPRNVIVFAIRLNLQSTNEPPTSSKTKHMPRVVPLGTIRYLIVLRMIGRSTKDERLADMTPNMISLDVNVAQKSKMKYATNIVLRFDLVKLLLNDNH